MSGKQHAVVVVGVDGSPDGTTAVRWAADYAAATGADLRLVTTWEWPISYGTACYFDGYSPAADAQAMIEKALAEVSLPTDRVDTQVEEGYAGPHLVKASVGAQALVVGSHGHGSVSGLLLGSVSSYCVHHATCPVVVAR
jgi:nucleotide-binding universal stress UspA family protein